MSIYFKVINNENNTIIDDKTSRFALSRKLPLSSMNATVSEDNYWPPEHWLYYNLYERIAPEYNKRIIRVIRYDFDLTDGEIIAGFQSILNDPDIAFLMERRTNSEKGYSIFAVIGLYTNYYQDKLDVSIQDDIAKKLIIYTFGNTNDITNIYTIDNAPNGYHHIYNIDNIKYGLRVYNDDNKCVYNSACRYLNIEGSINQQYTFSSSYLPLSDMPDRIATPYSSDYIVLPNSNATLFTWREYNYRYWSILPTMVGYVFYDGQIQLRTFSAYFIFGTYYTNIVWDDTYMQKRNYPLGSSDTVSALIASSKELKF